MLIALHKNARTTPAIRKEIAQSMEPIAACARRLGISEIEPLPIVKTKNWVV